jgi:hypothetical protein
MTNSRLRNQMSVVLHMVNAFVVAILLAQLWLFTVTLETMESQTASMRSALTALVCSVLACTAVLLLLRFFLMAEDRQ